MAIFAGIHWRRPEGELPDPMRHSLRRVMQRAGGMHHEESSDARLALAHARLAPDLGVPMLRADNGDRAVLVGSPYLEEAGDHGDAAALDHLHRACRTADRSALRSARGVFAAIHYEADRNRLTLTTDRIGLRPVYFWASADVVVFASALWMIEQLDFIPRKLDSRALTEIATLRHALDDRTPYQGVKRLRAAETVQVEQDRIHRSAWWSWVEAIGPNRPNSELAPRFAEEFKRAVSLRRGDDQTVLAFLSGGLDSRAVAAVLRSQGVRVNSFNFAPPGWADQVYSGQFAEAAGIDHRDFTKSDFYRPNWSTQMREAVDDARGTWAHEPDRPHLAWSGDNGSILTGYVYMPPALMRSLTKGDVDGALNQYLGIASVQVGRIVGSEARQALTEIPKAGMVEELEKIDHLDKSKSFYIYILTNLIRRSMDQHFETLPQHRLEFHFPFFDSTLLELMLKLEPEKAAAHHFYMEFMRFLPESVWSVPWQAYPGHVPCSVPPVAGTTDQWQGADPSTRKRVHSVFGRRARTILKRPRFPSSVMAKPRFMGCYLLHQFGGRDYRSVFEMVDAYSRHLERATDTELSLPQVPT